MAKLKSLDQITREQAATDLGTDTSSLDEFLLNYRLILTSNQRKAVNRAIDILNELAADLMGVE